MKYYDKTGIEKVYFSIGEVSLILGLAESKIRFWLTVFNIDSHIKRSHGQRRFRVDDVNKLTEIKRLIHSELYTIPGAKRQLAKATNHMDEIATALNVMP